MTMKLGIFKNIKILTDEVIFMLRTASHVISGHNFLNLELTM